MRKRWNASQWDGRPGGPVTLPRTAEPVKCGKIPAGARSAPGKGKMYADEIEQPFGSIESAYEYMNILAETALEAMNDLKHDRDLAIREGQLRRAQAIDLAMFKLKTLGCYVHKSRRTLNDLRILRRLILNERLSVESVIATM